MYIIWNYYRQEPEFDLGPLTRNAAMSVAALSQSYGILAMPYLIGQVPNER